MDSYVTFRSQMLSQCLPGLAEADRVKVWDSLLTGRAYANEQQVRQVLEESSDPKAVFVLALHYGSQRSGEASVKKLSERSSGHVAAARAAAELRKQEINFAAVTTQLEAAHKAGPDKCDEYTSFITGAVGGDNPDRVRGFCGDTFHHCV